MKPQKQIRACPLCGNKFYQSGLLTHLVEEHEGDFNSVAIHLNRALHKQLNRRAARRRAAKQSQDL